MKLHNYKVTSDAFAKALELSGFANQDAGCFMRISERHLTDFCNSAECLPSAYVQKVKTACSENVSGDFVIGLTNDMAGNPYLSFILVRSGVNNKNEEYMKQDTFAIALSSSNIESVTQCLHGDYTSRYTDPAQYNLARNVLECDKIYNLQDCMANETLSGIAKIYDAGFNNIMNLCYQSDK